MSNQIIVYTTYHSGADYGGRLKVTKFSIGKVGKGIAPERMHIEFEGEGSVKKVSMYLDHDIAIPLARSILTVAEGFVSKLESAIA